jgi:hypothetical protein
MVGGKKKHVAVSRAGESPKDKEGCELIKLARDA